KDWSGWAPIVGKLSLEAEYFDSEWKWMGSYATWRAAMFVFLYPENIAHPSLRRPRTPAFKKLVSETRANGALTPEEACTKAGEYAKYFDDVCSLKIAATCQLRTPRKSGTNCSSVDIGDSPLLYMFGLARSGKVYWSTRDPKAPEPYAQSFWD